MCGRYTLVASNKSDLADLTFPVPDRYNIAPQSTVLVKTHAIGFRMMPWSFSPSWARVPLHLFNARVETLEEKRSFKGAARCVFMADGWYEWQRSTTSKLPWYHHRDGQLLRFGGIYRANGGCAIVTMDAQPAIAHIHHRQPLLLTLDAAEAWLEGAPSGECTGDTQVSCHRVSTAVNTVRYDEKSLTRPVGDDVGEPPQGHLF